MPTNVVQPPLKGPVTLDDLKRHLRITHHEEDALLQTYINSARWVFEGITSRILTTTEFEDTRPCFPRTRWSASTYTGNIYNVDAWELDYNPNAGVSSIQYFDEDNNLQTLDSSKYHVQLHGDTATIITPVDDPWPATRQRIDAVTVKYTAGHGTNPEEVKKNAPDGYQAIMLLAGHYATLGRDSFATGTIVQDIPLTVQSLINSLKTGRVYSDASW